MLHIFIDVNLTADPESISANTAPEDQNMFNQWPSQCLVYVTMVTMPPYKVYVTMVTTSSFLVCVTMVTTSQYLVYVTMVTTLHSSCLMYPTLVI